MVHGDLRLAFRGPQGRHPFQILTPPAPSGCHFVLCQQHIQSEELIGVCNYFRHHICSFDHTRTTFTDLVKKNTTWRYISVKDPGWFKYVSRTKTGTVNEEPCEQGSRL